MDVDTEARQDAPDPFARPFKQRKQRHTRPLRTAVADEDAETSAKATTASAVTTQADDSAQPKDKNDNVDKSIEPGDRVGNELDGGASNGNEQMVLTKGGDEDEEEEGISMAEILRRRKLLGRSKKAGGLDFNAPKPRPRTPPRAYDEEAAEKDAIDKDVNAVVNRFTHTTGAIVNVDEHMMRFIESELQKRRIQDSAGGYSMDGLGEDGDEPLQRSFPAPLTSTKLSDRKLGKWPIRPDFRGAAIGKLQEIDLGAEHTKKNIQRTEEAKRRLQAGEPVLVEPDPEEEKKRKKIKKKRNEEELERDRLVEEVLKESRLDIYEEPDPSLAKPNPGEDYAADDRIAEQFRREFMEALNARRRGRSNHHKKRDETRKPRGPKLGGSRAARAAMRESERQAAAAAAGGKR